MGVLFGNKKTAAPVAAPAAPAPATAANTAAAATAAASEARTNAQSGVGRQATIQNKGGALGLGAMAAAIKKMKLGQ